MAGEAICSNESIDDWLLPDKNMRPPDIYVIGFQEIVELNVINMFLTSNEDTVDVFKNLMKRNLSKIGK